MKTSQSLRLLLLGAGTPENYRAFVTGGARGNGAENYTGALTDGQHIAP